MGSTETDESLDSYGTDVGHRTDTRSVFVDWVLLHGNRILIAVALTVGVFLLLLGLRAVDVVAFVDEDALTRMSGGMIAGTFSLVTLVVSINQMILSREFRSTGEYRDSLEGVMEFQRVIEAKTDVPATPAEPAGQLQLLIDEIGYRADRVAEMVGSHHEDLVQQRIEAFRSDVREHTEQIDETLADASFGTFDAIAASMGFDDSWQLYAARHLRNQYEDELSTDALDAFDELIESLRLFAAGREHFKTTYLQRELTRLSQLTILFGVPAVLSAFLVGLLYAGPGGPMISLQYAPFVVSGLIAIVFSPLALLSSYILRTATVARRTASIGPMVPQKEPEKGPFEVAHSEKTD